ncbi:MAG: TRAP transporter small permease subunit [Pseudomonadota bacterium]
MPGLAKQLKKGADLVGVLLFLATFAGIILQVFFRYVLDSPVAWSEEYTMIAYMWTVFWAAAFMVKEQDHVSFDIVYDSVSAQTRRWLAAISLVFLIAAFVLLLAPTLDYLEFLTRRRTSVLRIPRVWVFAVFFVFLIAFAAQGGWRLRGLLSRRWPDYI